MNLFTLMIHIFNVIVMWPINHTFPVFNSVNIKHFHSGKQETSTLENSKHADGMSHKVAVHQGLTVCWDTETIFNDIHVDTPFNSYIDMYNTYFTSVPVHMRRFFLETCMHST